MNRAVPARVYARPLLMGVLREVDSAHRPVGRGERLGATVADGRHGRTVGVRDGDGGEVGDVSEHLVEAVTGEAFEQSGQDDARWIGVALRVGQGCGIGRIGYVGHAPPLPRARGFSHLRAAGVSDSRAGIRPSRMTCLLFAPYTQRDAHQEARWIP